VGERREKGGERPQAIFYFGPHGARFVDCFWPIGNVLFGVGPGRYPFRRPADPVDRGTRALAHALVAHQVAVEAKRICDEEKVTSERPFRFASTEASDGPLLGARLDRC
jgi:hypothetical protein